MSRHDPYAALRVPNFRAYILALLTLTLGVQVQGVVVAWQLYAITRDPLSLGLIGLAEALPFIATALYAGHVADRIDRRRLTVAAAVVLLACSVALLACTVGGLLATRRSVWIVYAVIALSGVARSFLQPARTALSAEIVPRELYANSITWRSSTWQLAAVAGPALGGLVYGWHGATAGYVVDVALTAAGAGWFAAIRHRSPERSPIGEGLSRSLRAGLRFVWRSPVVLGAMTLDLFAVLFGGATALLPVFASEILHVGPRGLGLLRAAPAAGAVVVSVLLTYRRPWERAGHALLASVAAFGLCMVGFGLSRDFLTSLVLLMVSGAADMVSVNIRSMLLQTHTPADMLGRVSAVNAIFIGSSNEIGAFESGVAARLFGTARSVVLGGVMTLLVVGATAWRAPALRRLRRIESPAAPAAA
ncbi:MAG TPA: MFS transporter [Gemmatimonadaceae bacterium]|nr:MFS transporter [Gemmatimonadaceae bacterium]